MGIHASTSSDGRTLTIRIGSRFDFSEHRAFRDAYQGSNTAGMRILVDLSATEYMDSSALGMLLVLRERAGGDRADITLTGTGDGIFQVLEVSRFEQLFKIQRRGAAG